MSLLSVVVITRNEEDNIRRCLESVKWADELIVVDTESTDRTVEMAREYGAVIVANEWKGYGSAKRDGVAQATGAWVLSIDADEEVPLALADEVRAVLKKPDAANGYEIPRRTQFLGRWIKHCGWYPDYVLRLFRREAGNFNDAPVHEKVILKGSVGRLQTALLHYSYPSLEDYFSKFNRYTTLGAREAHEAGRRAGWYEILVRPLACFVKQYILKLGLLDGYEGFLVCVLSAGYVLVKYAKLRDLSRST